ncbi:MAG TPA: DASS family sodium-coupled anion symporter [Pyrinomonadaceae bacterium]|nr:DASS family sodium-coupled anion symporter [Pyrinomonadaceae bacterium]
MADETTTPRDDAPRTQPDDTETTRRPRARATFVRWAVVIASALLVALAPVPEGVSTQSWRLLAIFVATIIGSIVRPVPAAAVVLMGVAAIALFGVLPVGQALGGYADPIVWLVLAAFMMSRGMLKTGLGRRIAFLFIRAIGRRTLGLGYALISTDMLLATFVPSNGARSGGIIFPIAKSLAEAYDSRPGATARRLGAFLFPLLYQCDVIVCAMFLTGQASNPIIARFARETTGIELSYARWALGAIVPGLVSLAVVPLLLYRVFPPEVRHTPEASRVAAEELRRMGPMSFGEKVMLLVFVLVAGLWMVGDKLPALTGNRLPELHYAVVALVGICVLLVSGVLEWEDVLAERGAWDVFIWYGGLVRMAEALGQTGLTKRFAEGAAALTMGWSWWAALALLLLVYFYAHYGFASITAHVAAMYVPFLAVILAAGAPPHLAVLSLAYFSNLNASLTHYGTTPAPIWFGAGYVKQRTWWLLGLMVSVAHIAVWATVGFLWWKLLGWW